jgi:hypothetical protein
MILNEILRGKAFLVIVDDDQISVFLSDSDRCRALKKLALTDCKTLNDDIRTSKDEEKAAEIDKEKEKRWKKLEYATSSKSLLKAAYDQGIWHEGTIRLGGEHKVELKELQITNAIKM